MTTSSDDPWIIGAAEFIFHGPARRKRVPKPRMSSWPRAGPATQADALVAKIIRVSRRTPEVMVKVSGRAHSRQSIAEHLAYITRNGKLPAEMADGESVLGRMAVRDVAEQWWALRGTSRPKHARDTLNIILSMPAGADRKAVATAARVFARTTLGANFDYLLVHHEDTEHPHAHLTVRTLGHDGTCLNPRKADLDRWRGGFAAALRAQGVAAEATPRRARGVVKKSQRQSIRHLDSRQGSRVTRSKILGCLASLQANEQALAADPEGAWVVATHERQQRIRYQWQQMAVHLERAGQGRLADQIRAFVAAMPEVKTERDEMLAKMGAEIRRSLPAPVADNGRGRG